MPFPIRTCNFNGRMTTYHSLYTTRKIKQLNMSTTKAATAQPSSRLSQQEYSPAWDDLPP
eukprot:3532469-Ditylum_brightwellii.AAC.1